MTLPFSWCRLVSDRVRLWVLPFEPDFPSSAGDFRQPDANGAADHPAEPDGGYCGNRPGLLQQCGHLEPQRVRLS